MKKGIIIFGMGPGLSLAIAERFGKEDYKVGMISRNVDNLASFQQYLSTHGITSYFSAADLSNTSEMLLSIEELKEKLGRVDVVFYNAVDYRVKNILEENIVDLTRGFQISVGNCLVAVQALLPELKKNRGSVLLTGGGSAISPDAKMGSISLGKAGIRNLAYQLNQSLSNDEIFVGTVTISGWIDVDSEDYSPKKIADKFWNFNMEAKFPELIY